MSTKFLSPGWRMPRNANQSKSFNYSFTGAGGVYISQPAQVGITSSYSWWMNRNSATANTAYFYDVVGPGTYGMFFLNSERIYLRYGGNTYISLLSTELTNAILQINVWQNWTITRKEVSATAQDIKLYVDGVKVVEVLNTTGLGTLGSSVEQVFGAGSIIKMLDFSVFDYVLSDGGVSVGGNATGQVAELYNSGNPINPMALPSPPVAYYPLGTSAWNGEYLAENNAIGDYVFDFSGSLINFSSSINLGTVHTISYWGQVNYDASALSHSQSNISSGYIIQHSSYVGGTYGFRPQSTASTTWGLGNQDVEDAIIKSKNGEWVQFTLVRNGNDVSLYADGVFLQSTTVAWGAVDTIFSSLGGLGVCKYSNFLFWTTNLSSTEVATLYNYGSPIRTLASIPQNSNLKAWYKLDASEVYNSSTTEWTINDATANYKTALDFTGDGNHAGVQVASNLMSGYTDFTWSIWLNPKAFASVEYIMKAAGQTYLRHAFGNINFVVNIAGNVAGSLNVATFDTNKWSHIVALIDQSNSKIKLFVNGVLKGAGTISATGAVGSSSPFAIGTDDSLTQYPWNGLLSNTQVWNTTLTDGGASTVGDIAGGEIATLYNGGSPLTSSIPQSSNNKLWLKMDNLTTGIQDSSGNSNNGTASSEIVQVDSFVSTLNGESLGMSQANLVQSDLQTVAPYSKYALDFDAASNDYISLPNSTDYIYSNNDFTLSVWFYKTVTTTTTIFSKGSAGNGQHLLFFFPSTNTLRADFYNSGATGDFSYVFDNDKWYHVALCRSGSNVTLYVNGGSAETITPTYANGNITSGNTYIGKYYSQTIRDWGGKLSNCSVWNTALTSAQIAEIYNEGLPSNLNSHSAYSNLVSWWQLGENSSFDGNDWIVADEKGTNNGTSVSMPVGALVNGVGTTANGVSSGMSEGSLVGDAPYSTANALSSGMSVVSRVTGSGNTP